MQTQIQGHTSRSWDSAEGDMAVIQTALLLNNITWYNLRFAHILGHKDVEKSYENE